MVLYSVEYGPAARLNLYQVIRGGGANWPIYLFIADNRSTFVVIRLGPVDQFGSGTGEEKKNLHACVTVDVSPAHPWSRGAAGLKGIVPNVVSYYIPLMMV